MSETQKTDGGKPRLVGINHIAIEVGDIDQALDFYGKIFDFKLRAKRPGNAFIELGDQFINMMQVSDAARGPTPPFRARRRRSFERARSGRGRRRQARAGALSRLSRPVGQSRRGRSNMPTSSSPKRRMYCGRWGLISTRTKTPGASLPTRA